MTRFTYTGTEPRDFHTLGRVDVGDVITAEENPDPHYFSDQPAETAAQKKARVAAEKKRQAAYDALSDEDKAALAELTDEDLEVLAALTS